MNTAWTITLAAALLLAVALAAFFVIRSRRSRAVPPEPTSGPTPDGPGFEDGDPMPHPPARPIMDEPLRAARPIPYPRRTPRSDYPFGGGSSTADRMTPSQRRRSDHVGRDPEDRAGLGYDALSDPASPLYQHPPTNVVDTPRETSAPDPSPSWGGYSGGGYSSGHSSSHDSGGGSSYSGGSDSGGSSGGGGGGGE